jgi:superfamily I DNA/RNA helicase
VDLLRHGGPTAAANRSATGHLFIDEFQDVNEAQYDLVAQLRPRPLFLPSVILIRLFTDSVDRIRTDFKTLSMNFTPSTTNWLSTTAVVPD